MLLGLRRILLPEWWCYWLFLIILLLLPWVILSLVWDITPHVSTGAARHLVAPGASHSADFADTPLEFTTTAGKV